MENALNASAAAMNAVKAANDEDYKRAFEAYKNNMSLVEKRQKMIQEGVQKVLEQARADAKIEKFNLDRTPQAPGATSAAPPAR